MPKMEMAPFFVSISNVRVGVRERTSSAGVKILVSRGLVVENMKENGTRLSMK